MSSSHFSIIWWLIILRYTRAFQFVVGTKLGELLSPIDDDEKGGGRIDLSAFHLQSSSQFNL